MDAADDVTVWPIFDRARDDRWTGGRIALLGDACHPMRPFMAAGGAMAIEDAAILSRCLTIKNCMFFPYFKLVVTGLAFEHM